MIASNRASSRRLFVIVPGALLLLAGGTLATAEVRQVTSSAQDVAVLCRPAISDSVVVIEDNGDELPLPDALQSPGQDTRSGVFTDDAFGTLFLNQRFAVGCEEATRLRRIDIALVALALVAVMGNGLGLVARLKAGRVLWFLGLLIALTLGVLAGIDGPVVPVAIAGLALLAHLVGFRDWFRSEGA